VNQDSSKPQRWLRRLKHRKTRRGVAFAACAALFAGLFAAALQLTYTRQAAALLFAQPNLDALPVVPANMRWGFAIDEFHLFEEELKSGDVLGSLLMGQGLGYPQVARLVENCKGKFNINGMRIGRKLNFLSERQGEQPKYMVYEPSPYEYAVFQLTEPFGVDVVKREVETKIVASSGVLESSFWQALTDNGLSDELADGMIDILAYSVDFYRQRQGDRFKMVYEQHYVEGEPVGTGKILAALYEREGKAYYAFNYDKPDEGCKYFDYEGRPAKKAFLKSPVKFSRISSRYNLRRLHPILGYHKAHFGTDYAAPHGTPILSVAEGTVLEAARKGGNGNYVKIRHDNTYETQYLHMSGFAKGIRPGARVVQGQTIGYVGSTGLATGPHVCFRFWRNGQQVDHLRLNLPQPNPMTGADFQQFSVVRDELIRLLEGVQYRTREEIFQENTEEEKQLGVEP
jgi:murein DD-endopeptidase MepM/ murein hydrolase activator NlpD